MSGRFAGIDYGLKRIGLAISDPDGKIASPEKTLHVIGDLQRQVADVITAATADYDIHQWVVGAPLNMDGTEGPQVKIVKGFAKLLAEATGQPVHLHDERLSSKQADIHMGQTGLTHKQKKRRRDSIAAQVILQNFLNHRNP